MVRISGFHPENRSSILLWTTKIQVTTKIIKTMVKIFDTNDVSKIIELGRKFPNDGDFGKSVRSLMRFNDFVLEYPNDQELGKELRKIVLSKSKQIN